MSEKLLIERLKSLAEEVRGPVKEAMLDAAMALIERDALAARVAEAEQTRAHELAYVIETCAAMVKLGWSDARVEIRDLKAWATNRASVRPADSASARERQL